MKKRQLSFLLFLTILSPLFSKGQELFIRQEPASNVPKGMIGARLSSEEFREGKQIRTEESFRLMYAITSRFEVMVTAGIGNHHLATLPPELTSTDNGTLRLHSHNKQLGFPRPYRFSGINLYGKYLLLKDDGNQSHFRVAVFGEGSAFPPAHDEAEPDLGGDNAGAGAGFVVTQLYHKLAYSISGEYIIPAAYKEKTNNVVLHYPNAVKYEASFGFRVLPWRYKDYKQLNLNVYAEFGGKSFGDAQLTKNGEQSNLTGAYTLLADSYLEFHPGVQFIINSNTRIDLSMGFNIIGRSYRYTYPTHFLQLQHYFFFK